MSTAQPPPTAPPTIAPVWLLLCGWADTVIVVFTVTVPGGAVVDALLVGVEDDEDGDVDDDDEDAGSDDVLGPGLYPPETVSSGRSGGRGRLRCFAGCADRGLLTLSGDGLGECYVELVVLLYFDL